MDTLLIVSVILLWVLVLFNLVLTLGLSRRLNAYFQNFPNSRKIESLNSGDVMPNFEARTIDGDLISSNSFLGEYAVMVFLSPNCTPCVEQLPKVIALGQMVVTSKVKLTMISIGNPEETRYFLENQTLNFPVISASFEDLLISKLKAYSTPFFYVFNRSGRLEVLGSNLSQLESELNRIGVLN